MTSSRNNCRHTTEHLFWECRAFDALRRPFTDQIAKIFGQAIGQGASVQQYIAEVLDDTAFRNLGIVPGDPQAPISAGKQWEKRVLKPPVQQCILLSSQTCALKVRWAGKSYQVAFTDGSIKQQTHPWLAHGGWGIFAGENSMANDFGHLEQPPLICRSRS